MGLLELDAALIDPAAFLQPRIDPEIAFVLGRDLIGPGVTAAAAVAAVDFEGEGDHHPQPGRPAHDHA